MDTYTQSLPASGVKNYGRRMRKQQLRTYPKLNILYVASEMHPFLNTGQSAMADFVRQLSETMQARGMEIRIIMPRFGVINERKHRLHEVLRLSGLNIPIDHEKKSLIIKVASIPNTRMQVYFIDNDDYFKRKAIFFDKNQHFYDDNDERVIFFCKSVLAALRKLGWRPDIVHCNGWMTSLIPLYLKTTLKEDPLFEKAKSIYTLHETPAENATFAKTMLNKIKHKSMNAKPLEWLKELNPLSLMRLGGYYADNLTYAANMNTDTVQQVVSNLQGIVPKLAHTHEDKTLAESYYQLYSTLAN